MNRAPVGESLGSTNGVEKSASAGASATRLTGASRRVRPRDSHRVRVRDDGRIRRAVPVRFREQFTHHLGQFGRTDQRGLIVVLDQQILGSAECVGLDMQIGQRDHGLCVMTIPIARTSRRTGWHPRKEMVDGLSKGCRPANGANTRGITTPGSRSGVPLHCGPPGTDSQPRHRQVRKTMREFRRRPVRKPRHGAGCARV